MDSVYVTLNKNIIKSNKCRLENFHFFLSIKMILYIRIFFNSLKIGKNTSFYNILFLEGDLYLICPYFLWQEKKFETFLKNVCN